MAFLFRFFIRLVVLALWLALLGLLVGLIAGGVAMKCYPNTSTGQWVTGRYEKLEKLIQETWLKVSPPKDGQTVGTAPVIVLKEAPATKIEAPQPTVGPTFFTEDCRYSGRKLTEASLAGKVVLVYVWDASKPESVANLARLQDIWASFKHKPLLVIGSHRGESSPKIRQIIKKYRLTFPMYEKAGLAAEPKGLAAPAYYMTDHTGKLIYRGRTDRGAIEAMINAFGQML